MALGEVVKPLQKSAQRHINENVNESIVNEANGK
jgi:hypothetical protein